MHVLVATDGSLNTDQTTRFATLLAGSDGETTVMTVVRVPRTLVKELRGKYGDQPAVSIDGDAEYVGAPRSGGAVERGWPGDDAVVNQYLGDKRIERCRPIVEAIRSLDGSAVSKVVEGDDVEDEILAAALEVGADVIMVGSHGHNAFKGLLGSTGAKIVRRSPVAVVVLR